MLIVFGTFGTFGTQIFECQNSTTNIAYSQYIHSMETLNSYIPIVGCNNLFYVRLDVVDMSLVCYLKNSLKTWLTCRCSVANYR